MSSNPNDSMAAQQQSGDGGAHQSDKKISSTAALTIGAVGVVYGDIGTSPIYALREAMRVVAGNRPPTDGDVLGLLSIIVWSLTLIVTVKYALLVLRADNRGEGGTLSMMVLARRASGRRWIGPITFLGMLGAALFYGDAIISPAISVLSAVEGLETITPELRDWVIPITLAIIFTLFAVQRYGTMKIAKVFGPITAIWFLALGSSGFYQIIQNPSVLVALDPTHAVIFLLENRGISLIVLGTAFLAVTGAEALYVDLGHFGRRPILLAWFSLVFPALLLNYFGQGAYMLSHDESVGQPLFEMMPEWGALAFVLLAMMATVIASQAAITGAFSLTRQAIQLGFLPRMDVQHTSASQEGQIYMPHVNLFLMIGVMLLVVAFGSSAALAFAYGVSLSLLMLVTATVLFFVIWKVWHRPLWLALFVVAPFVALEMGFVVANSQKVPSGGWVSLTVAAVLVIVMVTWRRGSRLLYLKTRKSDIPLAALVNKLADEPPHLVEGTAVFLTSAPESAPTALLHSLKHYKVLHESNVILTIETVEQPRVSEADRVEMEVLNPLFTRVTLKFGFMEQPIAPRALALCRKHGLKYDIMTTSFFLSRRTLKPTANSGMPMWQDRLYILLARNASSATTYFQIPTDRAVEIGSQIIA